MICKSTNYYFFTQAFNTYSLEKQYNNYLFHTKASISKNEKIPLRLRKTTLRDYEFVLRRSILFRSDKHHSLLAFGIVFLYRLGIFLHVNLLYVVRFYPIEILSYLIV